MNILNTHKTLIAIGVTCAIAACTAAPVKPDGSADLRNRLTQLQSDPRLGDKAPLAMKEANDAVTNAEKPELDKTVSKHLVFIADRKIEIARAQAEGNYAIADRSKLSQQRDEMRLQSRTVEADSANARAAVAKTDANNQLRAADAARTQAELARADASGQRQLADTARSDADAARDDANAAREDKLIAQRNAAELQSQIDELQAKVTDRGLVLTLGDVLFSSGTSRLNRGGNGHLAKLVAFLNKYQDRNALVEGYTDSVGGEESNQELSQRRADAVKSYLTNNGVSASRIAASGKGEDSPVGDNATATGRQQNRRVEVIITNNVVAMR